MQQKQKYSSINPILGSTMRSQLNTNRNSKLTFELKQLKQETDKSKLKILVTKMINAFKRAYRCDEEDP
ncbi:hypothetical protein BpHYR1_001060 [Brachionus plicatilis]|uniref:Uncharacterized protein n=1 Tax=Brachionus plicatilis TaxID=10195 RepID=A0A3M7QN10_BRAPC|nr:hypothetical protein BpHYR1_001060 [Brachionus plicatilis]